MLKRERGCKGDEIVLVAACCRLILAPVYSSKHPWEHASYTVDLDSPAYIPTLNPTVTCAFHYRLYSDRIC